MTHLRPLLLLCLATVTLMNCDREDNDKPIQVLLTNRTGMDLSNLRAGDISPDGIWEVVGYEGIDIPDLPNGETASIGFDTDVVFAWGMPGPTSLYSVVDNVETGTDTIRLWDGNWCGTGYHEATAPAGTYAYELVAPTWLEPGQPIRFYLISREQE